MTTERQRAANRRNARQSTGPRSGAGKRRSAVNARRHGLTVPPEAELVTRWLRIILDDATALPDPFERDTYRVAALALAEAEAQLERVRRAEAAWFATPADAGLDAEDLRAEREIADRLATTRRDLAAADDPVERSLRAPIRLAARHFERFLRRCEQSRESAARAHRQRGRVLARYRANAEARRHRALRCWIDEIAKRSQSQSEVEFGASD